MKRLLIIPLLALFYAVPALAGSGVASRGSDYSESATLANAGSVSASFATKQNSAYSLTVYDASQTIVCQVFYTPQGWRHEPLVNPQTLSCPLAAGSYRAVFTSSVQNGTSVSVVWTG